MAEKILNTRILMKVDTLENWGKSSLKLKNGELAFATVAASAGTGLEEPVVMVKIGTAEEKTFAELPWAFHAKASDVLAACKSEAGLKAFVNGVIADAGIATSEAMEALAGRVTATEGSITALQGLVGDKKVSEAISEAVAAEAEIARAAEKANADAIDAIEADYLKAADKTELQNQINTIMNNPDTEGVINSINEFTQYIADHGEIAEGFRTDIDANADAIEAIQGDYLKAEDKNALQGEIDAVEGRMDTAEGKITALEGSVAAKAAQADLESLAGRVTTVEGDLNTESTGLKARMTAAEADIDALETKVGDKTVATQISEAIAALAIGDYAKAADLTAAVNRITTAEGKITTLEGKAHEHENKTVLDGITSEKVAAWDKISEKANTADLHAIATSGNVNDLVQTTGDVLVLDCGTSA